MRHLYIRSRSPKPPTSPLQKYWGGGLFCPQDGLDGSAKHRACFFPLSHSCLAVVISRERGREREMGSLSVQIGRIVFKPMIAQIVALPLLEYL